jgi:hypothetical protein
MINIAIGEDRVSVWVVDIVARRSNSIAQIDAGPGLKASVWCVRTFANVSERSTDSESNWLSRVLEWSSGPNLKGRAMKFFRVIVTWLAVQDLTSVDVVILQEIVRSSSSVFMFVHCLFDSADATFSLWVLNVCMWSTCSQSNIISAAPRC